MNQIIEIYKNNPEKRLAVQGIKTLKDLQLHIQKIFDESEHQDCVIAKLYKMVFPDWEQIQQLEGYPEIGQELWCYICNLFIEFDRLHHQKVLKGGAWINYGFSVNKSLEPWEINLRNCKVNYS